MRALVAAVVAFTLVGCHKEEPAKPEGKDPLQVVTEGVPNTPPCSTNIPQEWSPGLPVPALQDGKLVYKIFFGGWEGRPHHTIYYHDAEGDATFTPNGTVLSCAQRGNAPAKYPERPSRGVTQQQWDEMQRKAFELTRKVGESYASGKPDRTVIADYSAAFAAVYEPDFAASYRALSPDFWAWVEANGGRGPQANTAK